MGLMYAASEGNLPGLEFASRSDYRLSRRIFARRPSSMGMSSHPSIRSESGAFDMPSIIIGVIVVGILTAGVLATIFGVVPWSQDKGAQQDLAAVVTAQGSVKAWSAADGPGVYKSKADLVGANLISTPPTSLSIDLNSDASSFCASIISPSGKSFKATPRQNTPVEGDCQPLWIPQTSLPAGGMWFSSGISTDGRTILASNLWANGLKLSKNAGLTWADSPFFAGKKVDAVAVSGDGKVFLVGASVGGAYSLSVSVDAGTTWASVPFRIKSSSGGTVAHVPMDTSEDGRTSLIALSDGSLRISRDFGSTWSVTGPPAAPVNRSVSVSDDGLKLAIAYDYEQWISIDSGDSWRKLAQLNATGLTYSGDGKHLYSFKLGSLSVSDNDGANWKNLSVPYSADIYVATSTSGRHLVTASSTGVVYVSKDGGVSWKNQPSAKTSRYVTAAISGNGDVLTAGEYNGSFWVGQLGW